MEHHDRHSRGVALCLLSACGFGAMAIFAKYAYRAGFDVTTVLAVRFLLAAAVFWAIVRVRRPAFPPRRTIVVGLALGGAGYAAQAGLFFGALTHLDASLTSLLLYTYPAMVFAVSVLTGRDAITRRSVVALCLALAGAALVLLGGHLGTLDGVGVAMALGAAVAYSAYILVADRAVGGTDPFALSALITTGAAATLLVVSIGTGGPHLGVAAYGWLDVAGLVLISTVLAVVGFLLGLREVGPSTASIVSTVEPVVTVSLAMALFGERLGPAQVAGGVLVLAAVVLLQLRGARASQPIGRSDGSTRLAAHDAAALAAGPPAARPLTHDAA